MRTGAAILCLAASALMAGSPSAWSSDDGHKADAHAKKDAHAAPGKGKDAPAPPPRTGCYYNPNAPAPLAAAEQAGHPAPDAHGGEKTEHPAAPAAPAQADHSAPDTHGGGVKAEHPAAAAPPPAAAQADHSAAPDAHDGEAKAEHPAAEAPPPAAAQADHSAAPDAHGGDAKTEHPAAAAPPSAAMQADEAAPEAHGAEAKPEHPAAAAAAQDGSPHAPSAEAVAPERPAAEPQLMAKTEPPPAEPVTKTDETEQPYMLIRTLESVQDKIASGSRDAHIYQRELIAEIARKLPRVSDEDWKQPRNSRGAIIYALSGGDPGVLAKLLSLSPVPCIEDDLVKGLLDYSQGRNPEALALLSKIDARTLDPRTGGHLALAQAMLVATDDPKRAIAYLDMARLLAPGTLVEEAALRREAVIAVQADDLEKFKLLTSQYLRRYHKSFYAGDFIRRFAVVIMTGKYAESTALLQELTDTIEALDKDQQKLIYSAVAEAGIVRGRVQITLLAARKLSDQAKDDPRRAVQARLYESAMLLVTDDYERAAAQLKSIDRAQLSARDQPLLEAALTVASQMRAPSQAAASDLAPPVSAEQGKDAELSQMPAVVGRADKAILKADELLDGGKR